MLSFWPVDGLMFCLRGLLRQVGAYCGPAFKRAPTVRLRKGGLHCTLNIIGVMNDVLTECGLEDILWLQRLSEVG
jgi:hypothetical protein